MGRSNVRQNKKTDNCLRPPCLRHLFTKARHLTKFTRCARCGAVAPRVLGSARQRSRTAHKRDACFVRRHEPLRPQNGLRRRRLQPFRRVNSTFSAIVGHRFPLASCERSLPRLRD